MSRRRRPAAPGVRPPRVNEERTCVVDGRRFLLDRVAHPWSRARTCSTSCAKVLANRDRHAGNCRHCEMCDGYRLARHAEEQAAENGGRDETWRSTAITFRKWLESKPLEPDPHHEGEGS